MLHFFSDLLCASVTQKAEGNQLSSHLIPSRHKELMTCGDIFGISFPDIICKRGGGGRQICCIMFSNCSSNKYNMHVTSHWRVQRFVCSCTRLQSIIPSRFVSFHTRGSRIYEGMWNKLRFTYPSLLIYKVQTLENLHSISISLVPALPLGVTNQGLIQLFLRSQQEENIFMVNGLLK